MTKSENSDHDWHPLNANLSLSELTEHLSQANIPLSEWAKGDAKSVIHLWSELQHGESSLYFHPDRNKIQRVVPVVRIDVFHLSASGILNLRETKQEFKDGRIRKRNLRASLSEKMQHNEDSVTAAVRALQEEIGNAPDTLHFLEKKTETNEASETYPGLVTRYNYHDFVATLGAHAFNASGYIELQPDKTNYYEWKRVDTTTMPQPNRSKHK